MCRDVVFLVQFGGCQRLGVGFEVIQFQQLYGVQVDCVYDQLIGVEVLLIVFQVEYCCEIYVGFQGVCCGWQQLGGGWYWIVGGFIYYGVIGLDYCKVEFWIYLYGVGVDQFFCNKGFVVFVFYGYYWDFGSF